MIYLHLWWSCFWFNTFYLTQHHSNFATLSSFAFDFDAAADVTKFLPKENTRMINMQMFPELGICAAFSHQIPNFDVFFLLFMFSLFPNCQMIKEMLMYHYMQMRTSIFRVLYFCLQRLVVKFLKEYSNVTYFPFFMWSFTQILQIPRKCHQSLSVYWTSKINPLFFNIFLLISPHLLPFNKCPWSSFLYIFQFTFDGKVKSGQAQFGIWR